MRFRAWLRAKAHQAGQEIKVYKRVLEHPDTPTEAKVLLGAAVVYLASPVDLVPDWIPGLGQLDDVVVLTMLVQRALKLVPEEVVRECRREVLGEDGAVAADTGEDGERA